MPQEDATRFRGARQQTSEHNTRPRGCIPGWVAPSFETKAKRCGRPGASTSSEGARGLEALACGNTGTTSTTGTQEPISKSAKKNAKRSEKEEKEKTLEERLKPRGMATQRAISLGRQRRESTPSSSTPKGDSDTTLETLEGGSKPEKVRQCLLFQLVLNELHLLASSNLLVPHLVSQWPQVIRVAIVSLPPTEKYSNKPVTPHRTCLTHTIAPRLPPCVPFPIRLTVFTLASIFGGEPSVGTNSDDMDEARPAPTDNFPNRWF
jgi:hypothetical protein